MTDRLLAIACVPALLALLVACGQKGPLFLPGDPSQIRTTIPSQPVSQGQADDEESDDDEKPETLQQ